MAQRRPGLFVAILATLQLASSLFAQTQEAPQPDPASPEAIRQEQPSFFVRVALDHANGIYRERKALSLRVACEENAYIYVLYRRADGDVFQVFPNAIQTDNRLPARQTVQIPAPNDRFAWVIGPPFGKELIKVIASKEPLPELDDPRLRRELVNPVSQQQVKALVIEMRDEIRRNWAEDQVELTTYATSQPIDSGLGRRWGVFVGVSNYLFNAEKEQATGGKEKLSVPTPHRDARKLDELLRSMGQLNGTQVFTNEQATRKNFQQAVTQWLPRVSKPGDTVFIFFAGHGMQIPDEGHDEKDKLDEVLLPFEYMDKQMYDAAISKLRGGEELDSEKAAYLLEAKKLLARPSRLDANIAVARHFSISDDLFGHWLQKLSGRQVVVMLNTCHSGGFAAQEKSLRAPTKLIPFDFLDGELGRLKDLGQPELALLSACAAAEVARIHYKGDLSVFPHYLVECLQHSAGQVTLEHAYNECRGGIAGYFDQINQVLRDAGKAPIPGHEPQLFNFCTKAVILKP